MSWVLDAINVISFLFSVTTVMTFGPLTVFCRQGVDQFPG